MFGGDLSEIDLDLSTNAVDGLALPGSLSEVVVCLQFSMDADDRCRTSPNLEFLRDREEQEPTSTV